MAKSRAGLFADFKVEERIAPSSFVDVRYYPLAPSIVEFDPVGNREEDPPCPYDPRDFQIDIILEVEAGDAVFGPSDLQLDGVIDSDDPHIDLSDVV